MEERCKLLKDLQLSEKKFDLQNAVTEAARERRLSKINEEEPSSHLVYLFFKHIFHFSL